ncbi:hypothetical protein BC831DRAFT_297161 [Entophlyctis helioformis]|nr:hypothetical protein BC831DRAFT_297161 [Entophlyctis helioformis]
MSLIRRGVSASSEDFPTQGISQTLDDSTESFWSSKGNPDPLSSESLTYELLQPSVISAVSLKPFKAVFQRGSPTFAPLCVSFSVGFAPTPDAMHFVSPLYPIRNINKTQTFQLSPSLVVGRYLRIHLHGRCGTQPTDNLYYTVLEQVACHGLPYGALGDHPALLQTSSSLPVV